MHSQAADCLSQKNGTIKNEKSRENPALSCHFKCSCLNATTANHGRTDQTKANQHGRARLRHIVSTCKLRTEEYFFITPIQRVISIA